jgi:hypothetical protein
MAAVVAAAAQGVITPDEALTLAQTVESYTRTLEAAHIAVKRHWRGVFFRAWLKMSGGRVPLPWASYNNGDTPCVTLKIADTIAEKSAGGKP